MATESTVFPAFIRAQFEDNGAFSAFDRAWEQSSSKAKRTAEATFGEIKSIVNDALSVPRNARGALDLGVPQMKEAASAARAQAIALEEVARAAEASARESRENTEEMSRYVLAARAAAREADHNAQRLEGQVLTYDRLQHELDQTTSSTQRLIQQQARGTTAGAAVVNSLGSQRLALIQANQQLQDVAVSFASNQKAAVIFSQQLPQLAFALAGLEGSANRTLATLGRFGTFLSGGWGTAILVGVTALGMYTGAFDKNKDAADEAKKATDKFRDGLLDMSKFADDATGRLEKLADATLRAALAANLLERKDQAGRANQLEADAVRAAQIYSTTQGQSLRPGSTANTRFNQYRFDPEVDAAIRKSGGNAIILEREISRLAKSRPELAKLAEEISLLTGEIVDIAQSVRKLGEDRKFLEGKRETYEGFKPPSASGGRGDLADFIMPVSGQIRSGFGPRSAPMAGASTNHLGIDIAAPFGAPVKAPQIGTVKAIGFDPKLGKYVVIDHGAGTVTKFGHLSDNSAVKEGQLVRQGELIGRVGSTGTSTGNHLHYGVYRNGKPVDPRAGQFGIDSIAALEKAEQAAAKSTDELNAALESIIARFDPAAKAAKEYQETIAEIAKLEGAGRLTKDQGAEYRYRAAIQAAEAADKAAAEARARMDKLIGAPENLDPWIKGMEDAGRAGAKAFRDEGLVAAQAIAQVFGGKMGDTISSLIGLLQGAKGGNYNSVGGKLGGALTLLSANKRRVTNPDGSLGDVIQPINPNFGEGFNRGIETFGADLKGLFKKVFGDSPLSGQLGQTLGSAFAGAQFGGAIGKGLTDVLGVKGSKLGSQLGGAIGGAVAGPIGSIVGGILGSVVGGAFKKTKTGSATIGVDSSGNLVVTGLSGSSGKLRDAANDNAGTALTSIERIAEALGATVNASRGSVSIGFRDKNARVDPSGLGITKTSKGAIDFGSDVEAAVKYATLDLIRDGVLEGLRAGTQRLLTNAKDLEAGLDKALKFESIFTRLKAYVDPVGAALDALDKEFKNLMKIATEAGATSQEMADLEKLYGIERKKAIEEAAESTIGSLKELLRELTVGDNGRSLRDRRAAALAEYDPLRARVAAGDQTAYDAFAAASQTLLDIQRQISGSGSDYFALLDEITALTKSAISGVENVTSISAARESIFKAADLTVAVDNAPVTGAIDRMASAIVAQLSATNQNLGTLIRMQGLGSGGDDLYFQNLANF